MTDIVTRSGKGAPLTFSEVDGNFLALDAAINTVSDSVYLGITNVSAIPLAPEEGALVEVKDSSNIQTRQDILNIPAGFIGSAALRVRLRYSTSAAKWLWQDYAASDPDLRYKPANADGDKGDISVSGSGAIWAIKNGVIGTNKLANDSVTAEKLSVGAVGSSELVAGAVTTGKIGAQQVTYDKIQAVSSGNRLLGRVSGTGSPEEITLDPTLALAGGALGVPNGSITYSKIQPVSSGSRLLGRVSSGSGVVEEIILGTNLSFSGNTLNASGGGGGGGASGGVTDGDKGDITVTGSGLTWTVDNGAITYGKIQAISATGRLLGRAAAGAGSAEEIALGTSLALTGSTLDVAAGSITAARLAANAVESGKIADGAVTYGKIQSFSAANRLLGRVSAGAGPAEEIILGTNLSLSGNTLNASVSAGGGVTDGDKGDITVTGNGLTWTVDSGAITYGKIQAISATGRLLGRASAGAGTTEEITLGSALTISGGSLNVGTGVITSAMIADQTIVGGDIANSTVTYGKVQNVSTGNRLLGRSSAGAGSIEEIALGSNLTLSGGALIQNVSAPGRLLGRASVGAGSAEEVGLGPTLAISGGVLGVPDGSITYGKIQAISSGNRLLGRATAGAGPTEEIILGTNLSLSGNTLNASVSASGGVTDGDKGDITVTSNGLTWTVDSGAITYGKIQAISAANRLLGRRTAGAGPTEEISIGSTLTLAGGSLDVADAAITSAKILNGTIVREDLANNAVSYDKMQAVSTGGRLLGRATAGSGIVEEITLGANLSLSGTTLNAAALADGDKGDLTVSGSGATWTIDSGAVSYGKIQNISASNRLLGRASSGAGSTEELALGSTLGITGTAPNFSLGVASGSITATQVAANAITSSQLADNSVDAAAIQANAVSLDKLQQVGTATLLGRSSAGNGNVEQVNLGNLFVSSGVLNAQHGENWIINSAFYWWQRGTSFTNVNNYTVDRWRQFNTGSSITTSRQNNPTGGIIGTVEPVYFCRHQVTSSAGAGNQAGFTQRIENVRLFVQRQVTLSFYAKADASKSIAVELQQNFGTSGSAPVYIPLGQASLSTGWNRFSFTTTLPSISGKTLGYNDFIEVVFWLDAGSNFNARSSNLGQKSGTYDFSNTKLEIGPKATNYEEISYGLELVRCSRFFQRLGGICGEIGSRRYSEIYFPTRMRATPTVSVHSLAYGFGATYTGQSDCCANQATLNSVDSPIVIDCEAEL